MPAVALQPLGHPLALFGQKARILQVALPVLQVDFLVRDVDVAANENVAAARLQFGHVLFKGVEKAVFGRLPIVPRAARGEIDGHDRQVLEVGLHVAAFGVEFAAVKADHDVVGFDPRPQTHTRVALFLRALHPGLKARAVADLVVDVGFLRLEFLHAEHLGVRVFKPLPKPFGGCGTDAVGIKSHNAKHAMDILVSENSKNSK